MPTKLSSTAQKELDELLEKYPVNGPGTVIGVVNKQGEMIYLKSTGVKNIETGEPLTEDTLFWIASCTKLITGIAAMQLVERGLIELDEPVWKFVPELKDIQVIIESSETSIKTEKAKNDITLRMLLTHTSGWGYSWYNTHVLNWVKQNDNEVIKRFNGHEEYWQELCYQTDEPLVNEPGSKFEYGINMDWTGIVIERVTGQKLGDYLHENLFKPLGIDDAYFDLVSRPDLLKRLCPMHKWDQENGTFSLREYPHAIVDVPMHRGGGGIHTTARSYLTVVATLLNKGTGPNGAEILKKETVEMMFQNHCADVPDQGALGQHAVVPSTDMTRAGDALELLAGQKKGWGLSFLLNLEDIAGGRKAFSAEWGGIANLYWLADPTSEIGMVVFNDILPYGVPAFYALETGLQKVVYADGALVRS